MSKTQLGVSQGLYLSNSSVGKVLRRDLIQTLRKDFDDSVTLYLRYTSGFGSGVNVNRAKSGKQVSLSTSSRNVSLSTGRVYTIDLHQEEISCHFLTI